MLLTLGSISLQAQDKLSLEAAQSMAVSNHVSIKNSQLEIKAAQTMKDKAHTHYYPQVNFDGFLMHAIDPLMEFGLEGGNLPVYDGNPANLQTATEFAYFPSSSIGILQKLGLANLSVAQPIYTGGKIKIGNEMADIGIDIREEQKRLAEKELLLTTEQQYWQIVSLQEKQKTIDDFRELLDRLNVQVNDAYKAGLIIRNDVYKVELEQSNLDLNESKFQNGKELALRQFSNTIGVAFDSTLVLEDKLEDYESPEYYRNIKEGNISNLSEMQLLKKAAEIENLQIQLKEADAKPTVAAGVNAYYLTQFEENTGGFNGFGFVSVSMPLSHFWMGEHDIEEQKIKAEIAQNTLEDTEQLLGLRAAKSWTDLKEAYEQIQIIEERIIQANENFRVNQSSYNSGVVTLSDLLEAKALQTQALDDLIEAKTKYKVAIAGYLLYSGR